MKLFDDVKITGTGVRKVKLFPITTGNVKDKVYFCSKPTLPLLVLLSIRKWWASMMYDRAQSRSSSRTRKTRKTSVYTSARRTTSRD